MGGRGGTRESGMASNKAPPFPEDAVDRGDLGHSYFISTRGLSTFSLHTWNSLSIDYGSFQKEQKPVHCDRMGGDS